MIMLNLSLLKHISSIVLICFFISACSGAGINTSGVIRQNDPRPSGIPIASGPMTPLNGQTNITGNALIFLQAQSSYILRLEGLNITWETGLKIRITSTLNGIQQSPTLLDLRFNNGNQNYTFSANGSNVVFNYVYIYSTQNLLLDYASARLFPNTN
jgi:hypothetical protein